MKNLGLYEITDNDSYQLVYARIIRAVEDVFDVSEKGGLLRSQDTGGVLVMGTDLMLEDGEAPSVAIIGCPQRFTVGESYEVAVEKWKRLYRRPPGHLSAWQSRDPEADPKQWGGAIVAEDSPGENGYILSFSGLSEHADEAIITVAAHLCGLIDTEQMRYLQSISVNPLTLKLNDLVDG